MPLIKGHVYGWEQILDETGADGSPPYYLIHQGTHVVAACLTTDLNPDAPTIILAGNGRQIAAYADHFCAQANTIPVLVKTGHREWLCCGEFKLKHQSTDSAEITEHSSRSGRDDIYKILFLEEVES